VAEHEDGQENHSGDHDGQVHETADFDHTLFCQPHGEDHLALGGNWAESARLASSFMQVGRAKGLVEPTSTATSVSCMAASPILKAA